MSPAPGEWDCLRWAAKAADRAAAAEALRPVFEQRLSALGYSNLAIAHAFSTLISGSVEEALAELEENSRLERIAPVPLDFEVVEREPALPAGHELTIADVSREARGSIRVVYEIRPPLSSLDHFPRVVARDDRDRECRKGGEFWGVAGPRGQTRNLGGLDLSLPPPQASWLRVRMSWSKDPVSLWQRPAHELRITL
jgi:hypothetical protein